MDVNKISGTDPFLQNLQFVILMDDVIGDTNENGMWHTSFGHIFFFFFFFSLSFFFLSRFFSSGMILQAVPYEVNITISIHSFIQTHSHHFSSISKFEARGNEFEKKEREETSKDCGCFTITKYNITLQRLSVRLYFGAHSGPPFISIPSSVCIFH